MGLVEPPSYTAERLGEALSAASESLDDPADNLVGFPTQQPQVIGAGLVLKADD